MPGGIEHPVLGAVAFTAIKFAGYTWAAVQLNRSLDMSPHPARVGALRTAIGLVFGSLVWGFTLVVSPSALSNLAYFVLLPPMRLLEWWILIRWAYPRAPRPKRSTLALLVLWSYLLDLPAAFGLFVTGGFWIC